MTDMDSFSQTDLELALEKAYRRGFHQAITLLAIFYPKGITSKALAKLANEHLIWRRDLGETAIADTVTPRFIHDMSPLEKKHLGG